MVIFECANASATPAVSVHEANECLTHITIKTNYACKEKTKSVRVATVVLIVIVIAIFIFTALWCYKSWQQKQRELRVQGGILDNEYSTLNTDH